MRVNVRRSDGIKPIYSRRRREVRELWHRRRVLQQLDLALQGVLAPHEVLGFGPKRRDLVIVLVARRSNEA